MVPMLSNEEAYRELVQKVLSTGEQKNPRGKACRSLSGALVNLNVTPNVAPGMNLRFAIAELMSITANHNSVEWLARFNKNIRQFSDNGRTFHGHYGDRLNFQWIDLIERLRVDQATRQCVFQIWDWGLDLEPGKKDYPCNVVFQLHVARGALNMHIFQRSSDLIWGLPYDHFVFGNILYMIALQLDIPIGGVCRYITDLHVYEPGVFYPQKRIDAALAGGWDIWIPGVTFSEFNAAAVDVIQGRFYHESSRKLGKELGLCE